VLSALDAGRAPRIPRQASTVRDILSRSNWKPHHANPRCGIGYKPRTYPASAANAPSRGVVRSEAASDPLRTRRAASLVAPIGQGNQAAEADARRRAGDFRTTDGRPSLWAADQAGDRRSMDRAFQRSVGRQSLRPQRIDMEAQ